MQWAVAAVVADCSQAGVDYTIAGRTARPGEVADCSQAGVDYTAESVDDPHLVVADCSQAGVDYIDFTRTEAPR